MVKILLKSDIVGAFASCLCTVHCMATPFLFIAQSGAAEGCAYASPHWWNSIDFIFIGISAIAVYQSGRTTTKSIIKHAMWANWLILTILVCNEQFDVLPLPGMWKYIAAFGLISLHLYNLKYCTCSGDSCCASV